MKHIINIKRIPPSFFLRCLSCPSGRSKQKDHCRVEVLPWVPCIMICSLCHLRSSKDDVLMMLCFRTFFESPSGSGRVVVLLCKTLLVLAVDAGILVEGSRRPSKILPDLMIIAMRATMVQRCL